MNRILMTLAAVMAFLSAAAQVVTTSPSPLTRGSSNVVLTYHPDDSESNKLLANLPEATKLYAHIGLITSKSSSNSDWKYASTWKDNAAKYELKYVAPNTYSLEIGDINSYFNVPASETVKYIALVFRDANASKEGKTSTGGDILVAVEEKDFAASFSTDAPSTNVAVGDRVHITASVSQPATMTITAAGVEIAKKDNTTSLETDYTFDTEGSCRLRVVAVNAAGEQVSKGITYTVFKASEKAEYPGGTPIMGAVPAADGSVTFCLAAPEHQTVTIVGSWDDFEVLDSRQMKAHDFNGQRYFWITIPGFDPAKTYTYYYYVDKTYRVGDPYARQIVDPYNDQWIPSDVYPELPEYPSDKITGNVVLAAFNANEQASKFNWDSFTIPDHHNLVVYEMLFRDFTGTEGKANGNGTVRQAIEKISYLKALGVNAVEVMPIMEFNGNNSWGYNTNFYFAPDKAYGTPDDYKEFINECHRNGIAVILDIVFNQADGLHPWYQMYPAASNPFFNQTAPHDYSVLNDWKQDHPLVQKQWEDCIRYWMTEYNVDGFRFDLVKGLGNNDSYGSGTEAFNQSRIDNMVRLHNVIKSVKPNGIHINEHLAGQAEETQMGKDGQLLWGNFNYNFQQYARGNSSSLDFTVIQSNNRPWGTLLSYAESHDEERIGYVAAQNGHAYVKGDDGKEARCLRLGAIGAQLLLTPGPKMIWQFGELGADQTTKKGNDNNTSPKTVIWDRINDDDYKGIFDIYASCATLRQDNPELFASKDTYTHDGMNSSSLNTMRTMVLRSGDKEVVAFINPSVTGEAKAVASSKASLLDASNAQLIVASKGINPVVTMDGGKPTVNLPANTIAVFATRNVVNGIGDITTDRDELGASAYGGDGEIIIVGDYSDAHVYTIAGVEVGRLTGLERGIYIVNVDGRTSKVAVR